MLLAVDGVGEVGVEPFLFGRQPGVSGERASGQIVVAPHLAQDLLGPSEIFRLAGPGHVFHWVEELSYVVPATDRCGQILSDQVGYSGFVPDITFQQISEHIFIRGVISGRAEEHPVPGTEVPVDVHRSHVSGEVGVSAPSSARQFGLRHHCVALQDVSAYEKSESQTCNLLSEGVVEYIVYPFCEVLHLPDVSGLVGDEMRYP